MHALCLKGIGFKYMSGWEFGGRLLFTRIHRFLTCVGGSLEWMMASVDDLVDGISSTLAISDAEAIEIVEV